MLSMYFAPGVFINKLNASLYCLISLTLPVDLCLYMGFLKRVNLICYNQLDAPLNSRDVAFSREVNRKGQRNRAISKSYRQHVYILFTFSAILVLLQCVIKPAPGRCNHLQCGNMYQNVYNAVFLMN